MGLRRRRRCLGANDAFTFFRAVSLILFRFVPSQPEPQASTTELAGGSSHSHRRNDVLRVEWGSHRRADVLWICDGACYGLTYDKILLSRGLSSALMREVNSLNSATLSPAPTVFTSIKSERSCALGRPRDMWKGTRAASCSPRFPPKRLPMKFKADGQVNPFQKLRAMEKTFDICFLVGADRLQAHRTVLAATSPYLENLLYNGMNESLRKEVRLSQLTRKIWRAVFDFIYRNEVD